MREYSDNLIAFVREHKSLFWFTPEEKLDQISLAFLTETILNYGTLNDVCELFRLVGIEKVADTFFDSIRKSKRKNYFPDVENYFSLYFKKHVGGECMTNCTRNDTVMVRDFSCFVPRSRNDDNCGEQKGGSGGGSFAAAATASILPKHIVIPNAVRNLVPRGRPLQNRTTCYTPHPEILDSNQYQLLPLIEKFKREFYLVGGTAIALQLGHRRSIDFDLFKTKSINKRKILSQIENQKLPCKIIYQESDQLHLLVNDVKLTFFEYGFEVPHPVWFEKVISMPTLVDLGAMKAYALGRRAKWKDYVDLYLLLKNVCTLKEICTRSQQLFGELFSEKMLRQQLCYFKDIDLSEEVVYVKEEILKETVENFLTEVALNEIG